jgi:hypothetical protein
MNRDMSGGYLEEVWANINFSTILSPITSSINEISRLFPDSILFGSLFLYVLTQTLPYGVFAIFLFETSLVHKLVSYLFDKSIGKSPLSNNAACLPGFQTPRVEFERVFMNSAYPSVSMFFLGSVITYLSFAISTFQETLKTMDGSGGHDWSARYTFSLVCSILLGLTMIFVRWWSACTPLSEIAIAVGLGILTGYCLYLLNTSLFGAEGMNFLGLPYLVDKNTQGVPLYVCAPTL